MERILTLKVDLEYPDEADKFKWTEAEILEAQLLAMRIMNRLCMDGYSISWHEDESHELHSISVFIELRESKRTNCACSIRPSKWNIWIAKCVCLCRATGMEVPAFIIKKAGECW